MDNSFLGRLPGELRNRIYELTFEDCEPLDLAFYADGSGSTSGRLSSSSQHQPHPIALLATCKEVYSEARYMAWSVTTVVIHVDLKHAAQALAEFVARVDVECVALAAHVKVNVGGLAIERFATELQSRIDEPLVSGIKDVWKMSCSTTFTKLSLAFQFNVDQHSPPHRFELAFARGSPRRWFRECVDKLEKLKSSSDSFLLYFEIGCVLCAVSDAILEVEKQRGPRSRYRRREFSREAPPLM